jgi:hypothetical protein
MDVKLDVSFTPNGVLELKEQEEEEIEVIYKLGNFENTDGSICSETMEEETDDSSSSGEQEHKEDGSSPASLLEEVAVIPSSTRDHPPGLSTLQKRMIVLFTPPGKSTSKTNTSLLRQVDPLSPHAGSSLLALLYPQSS